MDRKFLDFVNLQNGEEDKQKVHAIITSGISFRGSNLWILACAIVIASIGLNVNSTAVIIGAMLISPLMGPIVGAGFALGTYDFQLLKKSGKNLLIATIVSLTASSLYFYISPFKEVQSELLARTSPTIYDVLIAFFGGLVGVIAITRVEKGNPIPGVAIATALMPPLCTAGYGIATGNLPFFMGAFYLFLINCFFICTATFLIIKYLKYQPVKVLDPKFEKQIRNGISILIFVMIVPSVYFAYNLFNDKKYSERVDQFISEEFTDKGYTLIYKKTNFNSSPRSIELAFLSKKFTTEEISTLNNKLTEFNIPDTKLQIRQAADIKSEILNEIGKQNKDLTEKEILINDLQQELSKYKFENGDIIREIRILFPEMYNISIGNHLSYLTNDSIVIQTVMVYKSDTKDNFSDEKKLKLWMEQKLGTGGVIILRQK